MSPLIASTNNRVADWLWYSTHSVLNVMPVVMAIGHRSGPLVVALATATAVAAMAFEGQFREWLADAAAALRSPLGVSVLAFLAFAALSTAWSIAPETSFGAYTEFGLTLASVFILALTLPRRLPRAGPLYLATSIGLACLVVLVDLWTDSALRRAFDLRSDSFIFNRPVLTLLVLTIPLLWLLVRRDHVRVAAAVVVLVIVTILNSDSGAAVLGVLAGLVAYGLARRAGRLTASVLGYCLAAAVMLAPMTGAIADRMLPSSMHDTLARANSRARIEIWKTFGEAVRRAPVVGSGFGASQRYGDRPPAQQMPSSDPAVSVLWHPHNAALQTWVELGAVGIVLGLIVVMMLISMIAKLPRELCAVSLALVAAVAAVSLVGHGAWQGWWAAAIGAAVVWLRYDAKQMSTGRDEQV